MPTPSVSICKFVGTFSLGLLTGVSATLSTLTYPALLSLPTALTAHTTLAFLQTRTRTLTAYLRHITTFSLLSAYALSPRRFRHPYLLYTALFALVSGPVVDWGFKAKADKTSQLDLPGDDGVGEIDVEKGLGEVNGEEVREKVDRLRLVEGVRGVVGALTFGMALLGLWGDGA